MVFRIVNDVASGLDRRKDTRDTLLHKATGDTSFGCNNSIRGGRMPDDLLRIVIIQH